MTGLTLEDLLVFTTGTDCVPPLGFDKLITIEFYDFDGTFVAGLGHQLVGCICFCQEDLKTRLTSLLL